MPSPARKMSSPNERSKPSVYLDFGKDAVPKDFSDLSIGDEVMVMLRGKVKTLSQYEEGSALSVEYTQLELVTDAKPKTMADALEAVGRKA